MLKNILVLSSCVVLVACAAPQPPLRVYAGPDKPLKELASIRGSNLCKADGAVIGEARIVKANGVEASSFDKGFQRDLLVPPGQTSLAVTWFYANLVSKEPTTIQVNALPGHRYIVRARTDYKEKVEFAVEDKGPGSGEVPFVHPARADGRPSNCY